MRVMMRALSAAGGSRSTSQVAAADTTGAYTGAPACAAGASGAAGCGEARVADAADERARAEPAVEQVAHGAEPARDAYRAHVVIRRRRQRRQRLRRKRPSASASASGGASARGGR